MNAVPTLHVRNVPAEVYERLRAEAEKHGRSINAEVVDILGETLDQRRRAEGVVDRLRRLSFTLPPGAPTPEEIIREGRDSRY